MAGHRGRRVSRRAVVWIISIIVALVVVASVFSGAGRFLVADEAFTEADVAVVLSGEPTSRTLAARDLYRQGRVHRIVMIPEPPRTAAVEEELIKLGLVTSNVPPMGERILIASGVPRSDFAFLPEPADGTIVEARRIRKFLEAHPARRVVVVTSKFASRRACFIFRRVLVGLEIICSPTRYDPFEPATWWKQPRNALSVVMEYQKLLANAVTLLVASERD